MADLEALDQFNSTIKRLVRFAVSKSPKLDWGNAVKRTKLLLDDAPLAAISALGPGLVKYRKQVLASDEKYFMTIDFSSDVPAEFTADKKEIMGLIDTVKSVYATCTSAEQKNTLEDLKKLLLTYDAYVKHSR